MGGIYLVREGGGLVEMTEQRYEAESVLQGLLADYPSLLAGNQMDSSSPRRWLLVSKEAAVPGEEAGAARWALDHLFLDQDAVPTLVEVKRSTDTRIRREVVGQMLDYAANAVVYWPPESMLTQFEKTCERREEDPEEVLSVFLDPGQDPEAFWQAAKHNLQAGKVRMVFVADRIPAELQRVVEFLNGQMDPAEVLAVEIKQYIGEFQTALVPRVLGQTEAARQAKRATSGPSRSWDEGAFFQEVESRWGSEAARVAREILNWMESKPLRVRWAKGDTYGGFSAVVEHPEGEVEPVSVILSRNITFSFRDLAKVPPFAGEEVRQALLQRLNDVPGINLASSAITGNPSIPLTALAEPAALSHFLNALDWVVEEIHSSRP